MPPITIYYAGTGFLIDQIGTIVTNRHLIRIWELFAPAQQAIAAGFEPDLNLLRLFLPGSAESYRLQVLGVSDQTDLAVLRTDRVPTGATAFELAPEEDKVRVGEPVVLLSYPGTFDSLLGRVPKPTSDEILAAAGGHPAKLADDLARRQLVRPLVTHGHISDVSADVITFDAGSATGSSGGPILNRAGRVIAVNHAVLQKVGGVHLGLPIRFARDLLTRFSAPPVPREAAGAAGSPRLSAATTAKEGVAVVRP